VTNIYITLPSISNFKRLIDFKDLADNKQLAGNLIDFNIASYWDAENTGFKAYTGMLIYITVQILILKTLPAYYLP
jgi:hypothetical protein